MYAFYSYPPLSKSGLIWGRANTSPKFKSTVYTSILNFFCSIWVHFRLKIQAGLLTVTCNISL